VKPSGQWLVATCDAFSVVPVAALTLIAAGFWTIHLLSRWTRGPPSRLLLGVLCGGIVAAAFVAAFPECRADGYASLDPLVRDHWLRSVREAQPVQTLWAQDPFTALALVWAPLLGFGYSAWQAFRSHGRLALLWTVTTILLLASTLPMFWQVRVLSFAQTAAMLPLSALVIAIWRRIAPGGSSLRRLAVLLPVMFVGSVGFWPAIKVGAQAAGWAQQPSESAPPIHAACSRRTDVPALAAEPPGLILNYIDLGPMLLFTTPHSVLGAPYHRNVAGLRTTIATFRSDDDAFVRSVLDQKRIDWIVTCPGIEERIVYRTEQGSGLAERLAADNVPYYLERMDNPARPELRLYRVRR